MKRAAWGARQAQVMPLIDGTRTARQVAELTGVTPQYVTGTAARQGVLHLLKTADGRRPRPWGWKRFDLVLPPEESAWLRKNTPQGGTVSDLIRSILVDVMEGEA